MNQFKFNKSRVALALSLLMTGGVTQPVFAEELSNGDEKDIEVIEIKGIKGSLIRAMDLKRNESGVVDAISAEEMGKFPDTNLAESLQRITGVSVSRANGEGSEITVRGFGPEFNLITLNGRQMPGTGNTRSFKLENLAADGVSALELYKTARAEYPSGGLGATVNIVTAKPLSRPGERFSLTGKGIHDSSVDKGEEVTPEVSALYSNTFADEKLGVAFSFSHQRRDFQKQSANVQGWQANVTLPGDLDESNVVDPRPLDSEGERVGPHFFPRDMNYAVEDVERERTNGQVTLQFAPTDDFVATLDYTGTRATTASDSLGWGMWYTYGGNIKAYELDENGTAVFAEISGNDGSYTASRHTTDVEADSVGLNLEWQVNDSLFLELDYHDSSNAIDNGKDKGLGSEGSLVLGSNEVNTKFYDYREGEIPHSEILWNNGTTTLAPSEMDSHFSQFVHSPGESNIKQLQLHGAWEADGDSALVEVKFGLAHTDQDIGGSHAWSGLIGGFLFNPTYTHIFPDSMFAAQSTNDFLDSFDGGGSALSPNYYYTFDFDEVASRSLAFLTEDELGIDDYFAPTAYHPGKNSTFSDVNVNETTNSLYLQSQFEFELMDLPMQLNVGVRYEETEVTSTVLQDVPVDVFWKKGGEWLTQYQQGSRNFLSFEGNHDVLLPMFDLKVDLTDDIVTRFSWGKSITRAPLGSLAGTRSLSGSPKIGSRIGGEGNTNLKPYESTNLDLSFEYYYAEGSYASIGYYRKEVENFISDEQVDMTFDGIRDISEGSRWAEAVADLQVSGTEITEDTIFDQMVANGAVPNDSGLITPNSDDPLMVWRITRPFNSAETKTVDGFEVAFQHLFGDTGFGVGINATIVDGDVTFDVNSLDPQNPLVGLSDSANFQLFYENHGLSVKATYAWRDEYLIGVGQSQGSSDAPPQFAKEFGQWDLSVNYDLNEHLTVFFEGINLNDETEQSFGRYEAQFLSARQYGPRYVLGARYSF